MCVLKLFLGTHWLTEIMKNLYHSHSEDNGVSKVTLTSPLEFGDLSKFDELRNLPNKRLIPTHLNYEMIPVQFKTKKCKVTENSHYVYCFIK